MNRLPFSRPFLISAVLSILIACGGGGSEAPSGQVPSPEVCDQVGVTVILSEAFPGLTFNRPVAIIQHPQDEARWYVVEQGGTVRTFSGADATTAETFIDLSASVTSSGEAGLLGMTFHPDFATTPLVYLSYTEPGAPLISHVSSFTVNSALTADPASEQMLISVDQPYANHNGGWVAFGPDHFLFIGLGDGGSSGDPLNNGQNPNTLLGAILRIDVDQADAARGTAYSIPPDNPFAASADCDSGDGCPEIYAFGFRNPWRASFDRLSGDLWVGDVGQNAWEEINRVDVAAGLNYGWNIMEGSHCYNAASCDAAGLILPVAEYDHTQGSSVTGGYVYRGFDIAGLEGDYIYGDFGSGRIWRVDAAADSDCPSVLLLESGLNIASFGEDRQGELYVVGYVDGRIYKLTPEPGASMGSP